MNGIFRFRSLRWMFTSQKNKYFKAVSKDTALYINKDLRDESEVFCLTVIQDKDERQNHRILLSEI